MVESGLNLRFEDRYLHNLRLLGSRNDINNNDEFDDDEYQPIYTQKVIDLHSIRDLFFVISMCYCLTIIVTIIELILYNLTFINLHDNRRRSTNHFHNLIISDRIRQSCEHSISISLIK